MPTDLLPIAGAELQKAREATAEFLHASRAGNTRRAYDSDWRDFRIWTQGISRENLPADPEMVALYLASLCAKGRKLSTVRRRAAAIGHVHRSSGYDDPTRHPGVRAALDGMARTLGSAPSKKVALTVQTLERVLRRIPDDLRGKRDRAMLLLGFAAALRRSELAALAMADVTRHPKGLVVRIRRSKTDQAGEGMVKAIPYGRRLHVAAALDAWTSAAQISNGPIFRPVCGDRVGAGELGDQQVARMIKARCRAAGLDPASFSGHSLRSGFITSAADAGASLQSIADHAGHEKLDTTRGYVQVSDAFRDHAGRKFL